MLRWLRILQFDRREPMKTKLQCCSVTFGVLLFAATIMTGIFFHTEILRLTQTNPLYGIALVAGIIGISIGITALLLSFVECPDRNKCTHSFKGLAHSRMKKRKHKPNN